MSNNRKLALTRNLIIPQGTIGSGAPNKVEFAENAEWYEFSIPIGDNETAFLYITKDAIRDLQLINPPATWF